MGRQSHAKQARRALRRAWQDSARAAAELHSLDPDVQARIAEIAADEQVQQLIDEQRHAQMRRLDADGWKQREQGADGLGIWDQPRRELRILHSVCREPDGQVWAHLSLSRRDGILPGWYELRDAQRLLYPDHAGVIVVPPVDEHYSFSEVHHVWTCLTARPLPDFRWKGQI